MMNDADAKKTLIVQLNIEEVINYSYNRLLRPENEIGFSDLRFLIFYEENQAAAYWGVKEEELTLDNPSVWGNYGTVKEPDWHIETKTIEDFFLLMAIYNGTLGGLKYNANSFNVIKSKVVNHIKSNWKEVSEISQDRQKVYTDNFEVVVSLSFDQKGNCNAIFIGTCFKDRFNSLVKNIDVEWSYVSYEDDED